MDLNVKVNDKIIFGRQNGEKTIATITKINKSKLKVRQDEARGIHPVGTIWTVPPNLCTTLDGNPIENKPLISKPKATDMPDEWWIHLHEHEIEILASIYSQLSPENLSCDGEASRSYVRQREILLNKKLQAAYVLLERELDESTVYKCLEVLENAKRIV